MEIRIISTNFNYDADAGYNIESVQVYYSGMINTDTINERINGDMKITKEEYQGNEAPHALVKLIERKRKETKNENAK